MLRFGQIGYGAWGRLHVESLKRLAEVELVAIACSSEATAGRARLENPGIEVYTDYRELLGRDDIEAVDVVVPTDLHVPISIDALQAGKHVLMEKPMAATVEACDRLIEAKNSSGKVVSLVHEFRVSEQWGAVKTAIESGQIGEPRYANVSLFRFPYRSGAEGWRYQEKRVGSWILEEPIHFYDLILWYFEGYGAPQSITAFATSKGAQRGMFDNFTSVLRFDGGQYAVVTQSLSGFEHHLVMEVAGSEGSIRSLWSGAMDRTDKPTFSVYLQKKGEDHPQAIPISIPSGERFELQELIRRTVKMMERGESFYSAEAERRLIRICLAAEQAVETGGELSLSL
ncbi:MAG: Gfo/Idh/MocA family oxidoreductase [Spirochaetaceae bacterium]|nr:MAG: Gfo/Idh/MocA family oxidoreductase [Spirochaetaceae bacterium]